MLQLKFNPGLALTGFRTTRPWNAMSCLQTFTRQNLAFDFGRNTSTLSEFIGYASLIDFHEILTEHFWDNDKRNYVRKLGI